MAYSNEFPTTLATIAAKVQSLYPGLRPAESVDFAWFSVNSVGDASIDNADLRKHYAEWIESKQPGLTRRQA